MLAGTAPLDVTKHFFPFGSTPAPGDACLISCEAAFAPRSPGGTEVIRLVFAGGSNRGAAVTLAWEYCKGDGWGSIGTSAGDGTVSNAEFRLAAAPSDVARFEAAKEGNAAIVFTRPAGWTRSTVAGVEGYWRRVRIASGDYGRDGAYRAIKTAADQTAYTLDPPNWHPPSFESLTCGCRSDSPPVEPERLLVETPYGFEETANSAVSGIAGGGPALHLASRRPGSGPVFGNGPVLLFVGIDEITSDDLAPDVVGIAVPSSPASRPVVRWDYLDAHGRWRRLGVQDGTDALTRSGIVSFIGPTDLAPRSLFGRTSCWLRATHEAGTYQVQPRVARLAMDTVWAEHSTRITAETLGSGTAEPGQTFRVGPPPVLAGQVVEVAESGTPSAAALARLIAEAGPDRVHVERDDRGEAVRTWAGHPRRLAVAARGRAFGRRAAGCGLRLLGQGCDLVSPPPLPDSLYLDFMLVQSVQRELRKMGGLADAGRQSGLRRA